MKARSIRENKDDELLQVYDETRQKLFDLRMRKSIGDATEQPLLIRQVRKDLARIKTVMREREMRKHG